MNAEAFRFVAQPHEAIRCAFSVFFVEAFREFVLRSPFESIASLALKLNVQLIEARGHLLPYHKMTSIGAFVMAQASASKTLSPPFVVDRAKPDELREYLIELRFRLCYCHSFRVLKKGCSLIDKRALPLLHRIRERWSVDLFPS